MDVGNRVEGAPHNSGLGRGDPCVGHTHPGRARTPLAGGAATGGARYRAQPQFAIGARGGPARSPIALGATTPHNWPHRGSTRMRIAVRSLPSIVTSVKEGMQMTFKPSPSRYPRAMAHAFTAWLTAPAPMACTSACFCSRTIPAIAPATAVVRDSAETLMMSAMRILL